MGVIFVPSMAGRTPAAAGGGSTLLTVGAGWHGAAVAFASLPGSLATWTGLTALNGTQLGYLQGDDNNNVDEANVFSPPSGPWLMGGILCRFDASGVGGTHTQIDWNFRGHDDGGEATRLYVYNFNTAAFETPAADSHTGGAAADYTLTEQKAASISDYENGSGYIYGLFVSATNGGVSAKLEYPTVTVTYS